VKASKHNNTIIILTVLCAAAAVFRLILWRYHFAAAWDEAHYLQMAASFARGNLSQAFHTYWHPLYPLVTGLFGVVIPNIETAGRVVSLVFSTLVLVPLYLLCLQIFSRKVAVLSTLILAFHPEFAFFSSTALADPLFLFFFVSGVYAGWRAMEDEKAFTAGLGAFFFGLAYLTKPEGVGYFCVFAGLFFIAAVYRAWKGRGYGTFWQILLAAAVFLLLALPYTIYLHQQTGRWTVSTKIFANQQLSAEDYSDTDVSYSRLSKDNTVNPTDAIYHEGDFLALVSGDQQETRPITLRLMLKKYSKNLYHILKYNLPQLMGTLLIMLFALGLFGDAWRRSTALLQAYVLAYASAAWFVFVPLFFIDDRYMFVGLILSFIWIGKGAAAAADWASDTIQQCMTLSVRKGAFFPSSLFTSLLAGVVVFLFWFAPEAGKILQKDYYSPEIWADPVEHKEAGLWLKAHTKEPPVIMSVNKAIDFYAGNYNIRESVSLTRESLPRLIEYARHKKVDYIAVAERYQGEYAYLGFLFDDSRVPDSLRLVYENIEHPGTGIRIFRLLPTGLQGQ